MPLQWIFTKCKSKPNPSLPTSYHSIDGIGGYFLLGKESQTNSGINIPICSLQR